MTANDRYKTHADDCMYCGNVDLGARTVTRCAVGRDLVRKAAFEEGVRRKLGASRVNIDFNPPATLERLRGFILQNKRGRNPNRDLCRGLCFGRWERELGTDTIVDAFRELWPKHKLKLSAADFVLLRDMRIGL